jgi:phenylacetic acid degradation operon negative regulatory protein
MRKITKIKTQYYSKEILKYLLLGGAIIIAASSPYFIVNIMNKISRFKKSSRKKVLNSFDYLRRKGLIEIKRNRHDIQIFLTKEGKRMAGRYQINDLEIEKPKSWDKKWRVVIFDIPDNQRMKRDVFRGKIKEFGFRHLQKSVWVYPYKCEEEIKLLREFLGLERKDIQVITADKLDNSQYLKKIFKLQ